MNFFDSDKAALWVCVLAAGVLFVLYHVAAYPFFTDDAYITLRYSKNLASGSGIVWNQMDIAPVEGYSNFLYVVLGAVFEKLLGTAVAPIKWFNIGLSLAVLVMSYRLARLFVEPLLAVLVPLLLVAYKGFVFWATSGLETPAYMLAVLIALWFFFVGSEERKEGRMSREVTGLACMVLSGVTVFVAALVRPEGPLIGICMAVVLLWPHRAVLWRISAAKHLFKDKALWGLGLGFLVPYVIYATWHWQYFGKLFPNTLYCKLDYHGNPWTLLADFADLAFWTLPFVLIGLRKFGSKQAVLLLFIAAMCVASFGIDPIIGHYNRHLMTAYLLLLILTAYGFRQVFVIFSAWRPILPVVVVMFSVAITWGVVGLELNLGISREAGNYKQRMEARALVADYVASRTDEQDWVAVGDCGIIPYRLEANVLDLYCLNSLAYVSEPIAKDRRKFAAYVLEQQPKVIMLTSKKQSEFRSRTQIGTYLHSNPLFDELYALDKVIGHRSFNYWIYFLKLE